MRVEVRATRLKALREARGLTGPKLQQQMVRYFGCAFQDLFEVVLVDSESGREQVLEPRTLGR